jgi:hypothetical protein
MNRVEELKIRAEELLKGIGLEETVEILNADDSCVDPDIEFGSTGIGVMISFDSGRFMYTPTAQVIVPGVRTFSNGDPGFDDTVDVVELDEPTCHRDQALAVAIGYLVKYRVLEFVDRE